MHVLRNFWVFWALLYIVFGSRYILSYIFYFSTVTVPASEMTYSVSGGALNSTQTKSKPDGLMKFGRRAQAVRVSNIGTRTNTRGLAWLCLSCCKCICQIYPVACTTHSRTGGRHRHPARTRATSDNSRWPEPAGASHSRRMLRSRSERSEQEPPPVLRSDSAHTSSVVALHIQQFNQHTLTAALYCCRSSASETASRNVHSSRSPNWTELGGREHALNTWITGAARHRFWRVMAQTTRIHE